jgi:hypothetical protein
MNEASDTSISRQTTSSAWKYLCCIQEKLKMRFNDSNNGGQVNQSRNIHVNKICENCTNEQQTLIERVNNNSLLPQIVDRYFSLLQN